MSPDLSDNNPEKSNIDFQSFLSALSGQRGALAPGARKKSSPLSKQISKTPTPKMPAAGGKKINKRSHLQRRSVLPKKSLPPHKVRSNRETKRTLPTGKEEKSPYLMGTREKTHDLPIAPETAFLPGDIGAKAIHQKSARKPSREVQKALAEEKQLRPDKAPDTRVMNDKTAPPKKPSEDEGGKIALTHVNIRPKFTLEQLLETMIREGSSDLHISTKAIPTLRINGEIIPLELPELDEELAENLLLPILNEEQRSEFEKVGEIDFSFDYLDKARFRINYFRHHWGIGGVFRLIPLKVPGMDQLGLPPVLKNLLKLKKGLILIAGPSGSGKSTTIAAMLNEINHTRNLRIVTLEKPVEYVLENEMSLISQREVGTDALSYTDALWAVLREDPDVIMVSELWEPEDIRQVLKISETGHLVIASIHTTDCSKAVERLVTTFPLDEHEQIRITLSESLVGVIAQQLIPRADGRGRVLACEILLATTGLSTIIRDGKFYQIPTVIQSGRNRGMQTMDQALVKLIENKVITPQVAKTLATDDRFFRRAGIVFDG